MAELRADVIGQIEELSTLVGDLVDLTRDDAGGVVHEPVDMSRGRGPLPGAGSAAPQRYRVRRPRRAVAGLRRRRRAVARGAEPARQRRQVEPAGRPGGAAADASSTRRTPNWWSPTTARASRRRNAAWCSSGSTGPTSARAMPGSGLGLAIVKQVVLKHGGALRVDDTVPGGQPPGTSIYVLLPGRPVHPVVRPPRHPTESATMARNAPQEKSSAQQSVISVDSQSTRAR